jgi:hypothetical protein
MNLHFNNEYDIHTNSENHKKSGSEHRMFQAMNGDNRLLVTDKLFQFERLPVEVQDSGKITDRFRGIYEIFSKLVRKKT